jgi:CheY-like chemotaxis protein
MSAKTTQRSDLAGSLHARRILIVDDNVGAAKMLSMLLSKLGPHEIDTAYDGAAAIKKIEQIRPEIVLLDLGLPGIDGYEVARTIRNRAEFDDILLVALTGYSQEEDRRRSKEAGFDKHLIKPAEKSTLQELLATPRPSSC